MHLIAFLISSAQSFPTTSFPTTRTLTTVTTTQTTATTTAQRDLFESVLPRGGQVVYDDNENYDIYNPDERKICEIDEYEIHIAMSGDWLSGTDDDFYIRLYDAEKNPTGWFQLDTPNYNDFERMSYSIYCMPSNVHVGVQPIKIGIRKIGINGMKINSIGIQIAQNCLDVEDRFLTIHETDSETWIKTDAEHFFDLKPVNNA